MKKYGKKVLALLLAMLCVSSFCMSALADGEDGIGSAVAADGTTINGAGETAQSSDGIIDANELKSRIDSYIAEQGIGGKNKVISIGYCYTATGDTWYYDGDQWCYSASLYKVPCCMLLAEKEYNGEITAETQITSQYASGTVDYMERKSIVNSDNYTGHAVVEYLGGTYSGKCADQTVKFTDLPEDYFPSDFTEYSYYSAKYYTQILRTLFNDSYKFPRIMDYMKQDQSYHYLDKDLGGVYEVAQKYGAFEEKNGNKNYHSAGIVYTPNPVIITVLTKNITGFEKHIGALSKILVDYTLELDSQLATFQANRLIAQQQEAARLAQEEQQRLLREAEAQRALAQSTPAPAPVTGSDTAVQPAQSGSIFLDTPSTPTPADSGNALNSSSWFSLPVIIGLGVVALIFIIVFIVKLRNARLEEEEFDEEDYEEYMRGDLSDLAPKEEKKPSRKGLFGWKRKTDEPEDDYGDDYDEEDYEEKYVDSYKAPKPAEKKKSFFGKRVKEESFDDYEEPDGADYTDYEDTADGQRYAADKYADGYDSYEEEEEPVPVKKAASAPQSGTRYAGVSRKAQPVVYAEEEESSADYAAYNDPDLYSDAYFNGKFDLTDTGDSAFDEEDLYAPEKEEQPAKKSGRFSRGGGYTPKH